MLRAQPQTSGVTVTLMNVLARQTGLVSRITSYNPAISPSSYVLPQGQKCSIATTLIYLCRPALL